MVKGVWGWLFQRVTGLILLAGLIVHFYVMHFSGHKQIRHEAVIERLSNPYWIAFDSLFLISAIYHGFNGIWGIALEYAGSSKALKISRVSIITAAFFLFAAGVYILTV